jgi:hypothetical protein
LGGAAFVVLMVVGSILLFGGSPDTSKDQQKVMDYWADSGHQDKINIGWLLFGLGVFAFIWFVAAVRRRILEQQPDSFLAGAATIGGILYATSAMAAISLEAAIKTMSDDTYKHTVYPELIHAADDAGYVIHAGGAVGIATFILAVSVAALRSGSVARWMAIVSIVIGFLSLALIVFFPIFLMLAWLLVASIAMYVRQPGQRV